MTSQVGTILDKAVRSWQASPWAFLHPVMAYPQPEQYELAVRIADLHPGRFDDDLLALLASPNAVVVAQALTVLSWTKSPRLAEVPEDLLSDHRQVMIAGCMIGRKSIGEIARDCVKRAKDKQ